MKAKNIFFYFLINLLLSTGITQAQWIQTNNYELSNSGVSSFAVSGTNLFAGTNWGVFLSTNNGTSWTAVNTGLPYTYNVYVFNALAVSGTNIFAGTYQRGVFLSTNNGTNWLNVGLENTYVLALAVSGTNLFSGTFGDGVFLSTNNGTNWTAASNGLTDTRVFALAISGTNLFAGTSSGVYLSTDNGTSWTAASTGLTNTYVNALQVSGTNLFAGTMQGVFLSTNNGTSWTADNTGLTINGVYAFALNGTNLFAGTISNGVIGGVLLSTNNGASWTKVATDLPTPYSYISALAISGTNLFAGTVVGVWRRPLEEMIPTVIVSTPTINKSSSVINNNGSLQITGSGFNNGLTDPLPAGMVYLHFSGPSGVAIPTVTLYADANGKITYTFTANTEMQPGYYYVVATDVATNKTTSAQQFQIISEPVSYKLVLNSPKQGSQYSSGDYLNVSWSDQMVLGGNYVIDGAKRKYNYKIELSTDGGSAWKEEATVTGKEEVNKVVTFSKDILLTDAGSNNKIKVTDLYNSLSYVVSSTFSVTIPQSADIKTALVWDYSFPERIWNPIGVACDGVARIYLKVYDANTASTDKINEVTITLSDDDNNTEARILGKVQTATVTDTYSDEANNASAIKITNNNPASDGAFWFWYVAPDDFCGNNSKDTTEIDRTVNAKIKITYNSGKIADTTKIIKVVRPPLLFAHGLGGSPSTWDNFPYKENDGFTIHDRKFINDNRFIVNKALWLHPDGSFKSNAEKLLNHSDGASFYYNIKDMRSWYKYASNQVIYIGHSMGGDVVREAINMGVNEKENYYKGYLNRVITINTPHMGSPAADFIFDLLKSSVVNAGMSQVLLRDHNPNSLLHSLIKDNTIISVSATGALVDLRVKRAGKFVQSDIPFHLITGDVVVGQTISNAEIAFVQKGSDYFNIIDRFSKWYRYISWLLPEDLRNLDSIMKIENTTTRVISFIKYIFPLFESNYVDGNDMVVSLNSQLSSLQRGSKNISIFPGIDHHSIVSNYGAGNRVNTLINSRKQDYFGSVPEFIPPMARSNANLFKISGVNVSYSEANNDLTINSPENNDVVSVDSVFNVSFNITDTTNLAYVKVYFQNESYVSSKVSHQYKFIIQAKGNYIDSQKVEVVASFIAQDSSYLLEDYRDIFVTTNSQPTSFRASEKTVYLMKNQPYNPNYTAVFPTFISQISSKSPDLTAVVDNSQILQYDAQDKIFKSLTAGETSAIITYRGVADTVYFVVDTTDYLTTGIEDDSPTNKTIIPSEYLLEQNYPNPFNPITTITYQLPKSGSVTLKIFDVLGREVKTLVNEQKEMGRYTVTFNASSFASGMYVYQLRANDYTSTKKMLLLK